MVPYKRQQLGMFILRMGIGLMFIFYGFSKLSGGTSAWKSVGKMLGVIGITWSPIFWGLLTGLLEFVGGIVLSLGLFVHLAGSLLFIVMSTASLILYMNGAPMSQIFHPMLAGFVFLFFALSGGGDYTMKSLVNKYD